MARRMCVVLAALWLFLSAGGARGDDDVVAKAKAASAAPAGVTFGQAGEVQITWTTLRTEIETDLSDQGESKTRATLQGRLTAPAGTRLAGCMVELRSLTDEQNKAIITDELRRWKGESLRQTVELDLPSAGGPLMSELALDLPTPASSRRIASVSGMIYALKIVKLESKDVRATDAPSASIRVGDQLVRVARVVRENDDLAVVFASRTTDVANLFNAGPKPFVVGVSAVDEGGQEIAPADHDRASDEVAFMFHLPAKRQVKSIRLSIASEIKEQTVPFELTLGRKPN